MHTNLDKAKHKVVPVVLSCFGRGGVVHYCTVCANKNTLTNEDTRHWHKAKIQMQSRIG